MSDSLVDLAVPDDSGRDAFERFRFQAHVAFPAALRCATGQGVVAVICEHFEDLVVEEEGVLRFTQIKTRNQDYGPWRFRDLCRCPSGALVSLLRTQRALEEAKDEREVRYEVRAEGVTDPRDPIARLVPKGDGATEEMAKELRKALREATGIELGEARTLLGRVTVRAASNRETIQAMNLQTLAAMAEHFSAERLREIYERTIELICKAMEGKLLKDAWPGILFEPDDAAEERAAQLAGKRLDEERLREAFKPLLDDKSVALAELPAEAERETALARKLRAAGAGSDVIERARTLRAAATRREIEVRGKDQTGRSDAAFDDLDQRLLTAAVASAAKVGDADKPAGPIFSDLLETLTGNASQFDPKRLFEQDGLALLGAVCDLSDECRFGWKQDA